MGLTPQRLLRGTAKNPSDRNMGLPAQHTCARPVTADVLNNVNIENSLKTMWNGLIDVMGQPVEWPHTCAQAQSGRPQAPSARPCEGGHQLQNKRHQPRSLSLSLFHMKVCKKQIGK